MLNDGINLIDGYVINIGVNFNILTYSNYNKQDVVNNCLAAVQNFFNINQWYFDMPINLGQLQLAIAQIDGVQAVTSLSIVNLTINDGNYSPYEYDIVSATKNNIIYPSLDPSVFEVKYPDVDIKCSAS
jgi:homogentisate 1,2-dioxygenase